MTANLQKACNSRLRISDISPCLFLKELRTRDQVFARQKIRLGMFTKDDKARPVDISSKSRDSLTRAVHNSPFYFVVDLFSVLDPSLVAQGKEHYVDEVQNSILCYPRSREEGEGGHD